MRGAVWRRDLALILALVLSFYSALALVAPVRALAGPEICTSPDGDSDTSPGAVHGASCLFCLQGCAATAAPIFVPAIVPPVFADGLPPLAPAEAPRAGHFDSLHRGRGPPTSA